MSFASDQDQIGGQLSHTTLRMLELRDMVIREWEHRVRGSLPQAECITLPILVNTLPSFYDNIAQAVTADYPRKLGSDGTSLATEHGGERARMTTYNHDALISEYQLFRTTIFDVLNGNGVSLAPAEASTIHASIDSGIKEAVNGFTLVHSALRERFAAALTHDMRTPLSVAVTSLELGLRCADLETAKARAQKALSNLARIDSMIQDLLHTMTLISGQRLVIIPTHFDLFELAKEVQRDCDPSVESALRVAGRSLAGWWGREELKRSIENMVGNAFKYGRPGAPVTVKVVETYGRAMVSVHNHGEPIPPEEQDCIFQMYRRAESASRAGVTGWGIGLPYVRAVAQAHGGSVGLDSSRERGTTFLLDIPLDARGQSDPLTGSKLSH